MKSLVEIINERIRPFDSSQWLKAPSLMPFENLSKRKILIIDDIAMIISNWLPYLVVVTNGNAYGYIPKQQSLELTTREIMHTFPDVDLILMDHDLNKTGNLYTGDKLAKYMISHGFKGNIVGFTSSREGINAFTKLGFKAIDKQSYEHGEVLSNLEQTL